MIREEDVVYAYRFMFDRDPENREIISQYASLVSSLKELRDLLINSTEFRELIDKKFTPRAPKLVFQGPRMQVELTDDMAIMDELFAKTIAQWQQLGETEPYWSVLTSDRYFIDTFHQSRDAFFATGESEVKAFEATVARSGLSLNSNARCLELGCGVGRVTAALSKRFHEVVAVDVSEAHLDIAKIELAKFQLENVIHYLHFSQLAQIQKIGKFDVIYSKIVLQHNPPPVIYYLIKAMLDSLKPGGIAMIQLPVYKAGYSFNAFNYLNKEQSDLMDMHYLPHEHLFKLLYEAGCIIHELREDDAIGISVTSVSNSFLVSKI